MTRRATTRRSAALLAAAAILGIGVLAVPARQGVRAADVVVLPPAGPDGIISGQLESFALRVEYDLPLPAGTGTVAAVVGDVRRSPAGENVKGLAAAPSALDAVVGGKYIDPEGTGKPVRRAPQSECFYPGSLLDTHFFFPTDTQGDTEDMPPIGYSTARCSAGPELELHAHVTGSEATGSPTEALAGVVVNGAVISDAVAHPLKDTLDSLTSTRASGISIMDGALKIGSVVATGHSITTGKPGGATTEASVEINDVRVGDTRFSIASSTVNGQEQIRLTVGPQTFAIDSNTAKAVIDGVNGVLQPQGCMLTPLSSPSTYPQGFLFSRPAPQVGVTTDGSLAASYRGGLLLVCDIPKALTENMGGFSPQRFQMLIGFAYTSAAVKSATVGGFNLGDLAGPITGVPGGSTVDYGTPTDAELGLGSELTDEQPLLPAPTVTEVAAPPRAPVASVFPPMDPAMRWRLGLLALAVWAALTHVGARRFLTALGP